MLRLWFLWVTFVIVSKLAYPNQECNQEMTKSGEHFCIRVNPEPQGQLKSSEGLKGACIAPYTALLKAPLRICLQMDCMSG